ncbi:hypothetical protein [Streptomyces johnsoniae]|uniref:DUF3558 domain-containing protein n=1 Tax=Streptomyces johnsoniae TaxID=3075532 RepID=A0ABU2RZN5_9ACTN|nr:hypothetical protein [Streptomyces sp. DSM 41886]MDT0441260.1 hypothetical protein [Streptomyces sp. DSM 41886]
MGMRVKGPLLLALVAVLAGTSCSGESDSESIDYAIPEDLCDIAVDEREFAPLFPPGREVAVENRLEDRSDDLDYVQPFGECVVSVDGTTALFIDAMSASDGGVDEGAQAYVEDFLRDAEYDPADAEWVPSPLGELLVWRDFATMYVPCAASPALDFTGLNVSIRLDWPGPFDDYSEQLSEAIQPFAEEFIARQMPGTCDPA